MRKSNKSTRKQDVKKDKLELTETEKILVDLDKIARGKDEWLAKTARSLCKWYLIHKSLTFPQTNLAKDLIERTSSKKSYNAINYPRKLI